MSVVSAKQKMTIYILPQTYAKLKAYVKASSVECSMLCQVQLNYSSEVKMLITKMVVPYQTRMATETTIDETRLFEVLTAEGIDHQKLKCWLHSHVNMSTSPSGQDQKQAAILMNDCEWFIRGIFNKRNEYTLSVHWMGVEIEAVLEILDTTNPIDMKAIEKQLEDKTIKHAWTPPARVTPMFNSGYEDYYEDVYRRDTANSYNEYNKKKGKTKNKKKITYAEFLAMFPGMGQKDYLNYLQNNNSIADQEEIPLVITDQRHTGVGEEKVIWQTV